MIVSDYGIIYYNINGSVAMNLRKGISNGRAYLSIVQGYRDPVTKKVRHKTVKSLGYLDDLKIIYPDTVAHFKTVVLKAIINSIANARDYSRIIAIK